MAENIIILIDEFIKVYGKTTDLFKLSRTKGKLNISECFKLVHFIKKK